MKHVLTGCHRSARAVCLRLVIALVVCMLPSLAVAAEEDFITLTAETTRWYPDKKVTATGGVEASYKDYKITAVSAEADLQTNVAVFKGDVKLSTGQYNAEGEVLTLNLKTRDWALEKASSRLEPGSLQGNLAGSAFLRSSKLSGSGEALALREGTFTTCDLQHPHYYFSARELEIYPDSKVVARNVSIVGLDKRIFTLNSLVIPIKGFRHSFVPQVGSSAEEGTFLKAAYAYTARKDSQGFLKLDLMSKRGIGTGIEHTYGGPTSSGLVSVYHLFDRELDARNLTGRFQHQQKLGSINLNLTSNYRTNSYLYYPSTTSDNSEVMLSHSGRRTSTSLSFRRNASRGTGDYSTYTNSLRHSQRFSSKLNGVFSADMRIYRSSGFQAADRELESGMELRYGDDKFDLSLLASKRFDVDGGDYTGDDYYGSLDRLPELTFQTDTYRAGIKFPFGLPARLGMSAGRYHEEPSGATSDRLLLQLDMLGKTLDLGGKSELNLVAGLRQALYAGDMAQYVLRANGVLTTRFNDYLKTRVAYSYQKPEGFSPFRFDYAGNYNYVRAVVDYQDDERLRWSLATGYDFRQDRYPWHDMMLRLTAHPTPSFAYSLSTGYNLNDSKWRSLITRFQVGDPERLMLDLGSRYDLELGKFGLIRSRFDVPIGSKWRVEGLLGWNGQMNKFDYRSIRLTRDLHCWEASLEYIDEVGFRKDRGLRLDLRIKAFPFRERFGIGQYGQAIDTSMGEFYY